MNKGTRGIVNKIFGDHATSYFVIGANFVNREKTGPEVEKEFPSEILDQKFLLHPIRLAMCKLLTENSRITSAELREKLGIFKKGAADEIGGKAWKSVKEYRKSLFGSFVKRVSGQMSSGGR